MHVAQAPKGRAPGHGGTDRNQKRYAQPNGIEAIDITILRAPRIPDRLVVRSHGRPEPGKALLVAVEQAAGSRTRRIPMVHRVVGEGDNGKPASTWIAPRMR